MQATIDILKAAATSSGVFNTVEDQAPNEIASSDLPAFVQHEYSGFPQVRTTTVYEGTLNYTCYIVARDSDSWTTTEGYVDSYLVALFARSEAKAAGYALVPPYRRYMMQIGRFRCRVIEFTIVAPFNKEYA